MSDDQAFIEELRNEFLAEVILLLEECEASYLLLEKPEHRVDELTKIFRFAHSLKGTGSSVGFHDLAGFAHLVEDCLSVLRSQPDLVTHQIISLLLKASDAFKARITALRQGLNASWDVEDLKLEFVNATAALLAGASSQTEIPQTPLPDQSAESPEMKFPPLQPHAGGPTSEQKVKALMRVDPARVDAVMDLVGELIIIKGQLIQSGGNNGTRQTEVLALLDKTVRELQDRTLSMRLTSLKPIFLKVQRIVRDISAQLGKPVEFVMTGEDIEIDRTMIESLGDPLVHIARNAVDHGIEMPEVRRKLGKPEKATVIMSARQTGGNVVIEVKEDGGGIDRNKITRKAVERGLLSPTVNPDAMTDQQVFAFLFMPGFSTAEKITDVSGRGVGLDVVKSSVEKLKGSIALRSEVGSGSVFSISVPLTTAITDGIILMINSQRFIVPLSSIQEIVQIEEKDVMLISPSCLAVNIRGKVLPLVPLADVLKAASQFKAARISDEKQKVRNLVLVIERMGVPMGLRIDSVIGQSQVVIKALGDTLKGIAGLAGASIMGDGRIALVLDIDHLAKRTPRPEMPKAS